MCLVSGQYIYNKLVIMQSRAGLSHFTAISRGAISNFACHEQSTLHDSEKDLSVAFHFHQCCLSCAAVKDGQVLSTLVVYIFLTIRFSENVACDVLFRSTLFGR